MNTASTLSRLAMSVMLLIVASNALAEDECQLNLNESLLDFGLMSRIAQQDSTLERPLGERRVSLNVSCAQPTDMSLFYQALAATSQRLRFTEHGSYAIQASDAVLDGTAVELGLIPALGQPPVARGALLNWRTGHGIAPVNGETLLNGQHFSVQLTFSAFADIAARYFGKSIPITAAPASASFCASAWSASLQPSPSEISTIFARRSPSGSRI